MVICHKLTSRNQQCIISQRTGNELTRENYEYLKSVGLQPRDGFVSIIGGDGASTIPRSYYPDAIHRAQAICFDNIEQQRRDSHRNSESRRFNAS